MSLSPDTMQAARLAVLEGAVLALVREAGSDFDQLTIEVSWEDGSVGIDLMYSANGLPLSGQSL